ncbi:RagB/SusD family nutrient uptake outer membrane protein [Flavobacterium sp. W1B]|uniref:RagB/SusD family nutrient uptake outer membrane protein n=1 Tax=Flavobacterium sp. W1B TaxID=3394146 RepID=UPI0039BCD836
MKTYIHTIAHVLLAFTVILLCSCESFTEIDMPQNQLTSESVFNDLSTANAALSDIYSRIRDEGVSSGSLTSLTPLLANYADDLTFYGTNVNIQAYNNHTINPSTPYLSRLWKSAYSQIYAINSLIEGIKSTKSIAGIEHNRVLGEAIFLRAYLHSFLVNMHGDIPYVTSTNYAINKSISKTPVKEVWAAIITDLNLAEELLTDNYPTKGRVRPNKGTVKAMLARTNLYTENYTAAEAAATAVINNPQYIWVNDPALEFLNNSSAIIWSLHPGIVGVNTVDAKNFNFTSGPPSKATLSLDLHNAFETADLRKTLWIKTVTSGSNSWYQPFKYKKTTNTGTSVENTILFRLAEQYLIRAEARARIGNIIGAQLDLNKVRNRAGLNNTTANTEAALIVAIINERRFEFFTEQGHRWFDLKRTGMLSQSLKNIKPGWRETDILLPIPESEISLNRNLLPQNQGY